MAQENTFSRDYDLNKARRQSSTRTPAPHQSAALDKLHTWFESKHTGHAGSLLVLPTGAGKTFTALRFLCTGPLSKGYKVLWLAHTHHLLEQALDGLDKEVGHILEPRPHLHVRVVSGTPGHYRVSDIKKTDDIVICTLQTLVSAQRSQHPQLQAFLASAGDKLFVIFDEAHHSPAYSYRTLIHELRRVSPHMFLLGLTATPTYSDEKKRGWLTELFPQNILYQVSPQTLMADGTLAKPEFEEHYTNFEPNFDEREYQHWVGTYRDIPEDIITQLAENNDRNTQIAEYYAQNRRHYGKTIIFADRWFQCEQLRQFLRNRQVRADVVYSHVDAEPGSPEARNRRTADENKQALEAFRQGNLDVLINVRMLTEGTDVPDVNSVFLTRQTTSSILLTQMIGRALRGPKFGGTPSAHIVAFIDNWRQLINWADYELFNDGKESDPSPTKPRPPLQLISIDLVRDLTSKMDRGLLIETAPFLTLLPLGWYHVEFTSVVAATDDANLATGDDQEWVQQVIMVFEHEQEAYRLFVEALVSALRQGKLQQFADEAVHLRDQQPQLEQWREQFFPDGGTHVGGDLLFNLFHLARHVAQNESAPRFFLFEERNNHNLDAITQQFINDDLGPRRLNDALSAEYTRADRYWRAIYPDYGRFKSHYDACANRLLGVGQSEMPGDIYDTNDQPPTPELSSAVKQQVKVRDKDRCLCCGETNRQRLQIDHVAPSYFGGSNELDNLQTLCRTCNNHKAINQINFRNNRTLLTVQPTNFPLVDLPRGENAREANEWRKFLQRSVNFFYRCAAVENVIIKEQGSSKNHWEIKLYVGNDPRWIEPYLQSFLQRIQVKRETAGQKGPTKISVTAPNCPPVTAS